MADQIEPDGRAVLSMFTPPDGHHFIGGFVVTHNANEKQIKTLVAPTLRGVTTTVQRRRILETRPYHADQRLAVIAAGDQILRGGDFIPWITIVPVYGRRLHAKFGVLQFKSDKGQVRTRAFVTSANMTRGGLITNHEFLLYDECTKKATRHLTFDLMRAVRGLRPDLVDGQWKVVDDVLVGLRRGLSPNGTVTGTVSHSLDKRRDITAAWAKSAMGTNAKVAHVTIVSPGFAAPTDGVSVPGLDRVLGHVGTVRLITSTDSAGRPVCSRAVLDRLRASDLSIETPQVGEDPRESGRSLHAKLLAASTGGRRHHVLIGSANFTTRGLSGVNRELAVLTRLSTSGLNDLLAGIAPLPTTANTVDPEDAKWAAEVERPSDTTLARFVLHQRAHATQLRWNGTLHLEFEGRSPTRLTHGETVLSITDHQPLVLDSSNPNLVVTYPGRDPRVVPIEVEPPKGHDEQFWAGIGSGEELEDHPFLSMLLKDLRVAASTERDDADPGAEAPAGDGTVPPPVGKGADDRFQIPLRQRLVLVVRNRHLIDNQIPPSTLRAAVESYLADDGPEAVAIGLAAAISSSDSVTQPLVQAFTEALGDFPLETRW